MYCFFDHIFNFIPFLELVLFFFFFFYVSDMSRANFNTRKEWVLTEQFTTYAKNHNKKN